MLINVVYDIATGGAPLGFFMISIKNGVLYGRLIDILNRGSEIAILAIGMTLVVSASGGTDISVGSVMSLYAGVCCLILAGYGNVNVQQYAHPLLAGIGHRPSCDFDLRYFQWISRRLHEYPADGRYPDLMVGGPCDRTASLQQPDRIRACTVFPEARRLLQYLSRPRLLWPRFVWRLQQ